MFKMIFRKCIIVFILSLTSSNFISQVACTSVTYVDTLIANFLNKETNIWEKIDKRMNPLPEIQLIVSENNTDIPSDYMYEMAGDVNRFVFANKLAQPFNMLDNFWSDIQNTWYREEKENRTNLTMQEINKKYSEMEKLFNDYFNFTSQDLFWQYGIAKMNYVYEDDGRKTSHHILTALYKHIQLVLLRAYTMCQLFNFLGHYHFQGEYRAQGINLRTEYLNKVSIIREIAKQYLGMVSREVYGWNKVLYYKNMRYEEITNFLQGYIVNEVNLNMDGSCSTTCDDYDKIEQKSCNVDTGCSLNLKCNGVLRHCKELEDVQICTAEGGKKRYSQVKYDDGRIARNSDQCQNEVKFNGFTKWFSKCTNCFCFCDDPSISDRYFSLREVISNIDANKVVTGVRLLKYNRMIQLDILEQELKPYGATDYKRFSFYDNWEFKGSEFQINDTDVREGIDYHTLTQENRSINLDTVVVPDGYVVTGVRFRLVHGHIALQVRGTEFDYGSGELINKNGSRWFLNPSSGSEELILGEVAPPFEESITPIVNKKNNLFIKFTPTDYWSDISQTTVPLISVDNVSADEKTALSGVGLYHKSAEGFGGFIAVKLVVLDSRPYIPVK